MLLPAIVFSFGLSTAQATTMVELTIDQLVDASDNIVKGVVTEIWTEPDSKTGMIWTHAQIEVETVLKGNSELDIVVLEQPGGIWGTKDAIVEGVARFSVGESGYFFVEDLDSGRSVPVGMFQGKFNILMDPYSQKEITTRFALPLRRNFDHRFIPLPDKSKRITVANFEQQIIQRVQTGWDGKPIPGKKTEKLRKINKINPNVGTKR